MVATSGAKLISDDAIETLKEYLIPMATVITPNIPEAEVLSEMKITNEEEMIKAAEKISKKYIDAAAFINIFTKEKVICLLVMMQL